MASCWAGVFPPNGYGQKMLSSERASSLGVGLRSKGLAEDVAVIHGEFADYLRARHYAPFTVDHYQRRLVRVASWLREHADAPLCTSLLAG